MKGDRGPPGPQDGGSVYTRWGRTSCPSVSGTTEVYNGYAAGSHWNTQGGGATVLCLPKDPQYYDTYNTGTQDYSRIAIAEYGAHQGSNAEYEIPCAVCMTTRLTLLMIPARYSCPSGWTREYYGHLGSSRKGNYRVEYICVDYFAQRRGSNSNDATVLDIVRVEVFCTHSMPCPPYNSYKEVSCVVCSK